MSAEGNPVVGRIIAEIFDDTSNAFIEAIEQSLPRLPRRTIVLALPVPARRAVLFASSALLSVVTRLSRGEADGADMAEAIEQLVFRDGGLPAGAGDRSTREPGKTQFAPDQIRQAARESAGSAWLGRSRTDL